MALPTSLVALTVGAFHWKLSGADARRVLACLGAATSLSARNVVFPLNGTCTVRDSSPNDQVGRFPISSGFWIRECKLVLVDHSGLRGCRVVPSYLPTKNTRIEI